MNCIVGTCGGQTRKKLQGCLVLGAASAVDLSQRFQPPQLLLLMVLQYRLEVRYTFNETSLSKDEQAAAKELFQR